MVERKLKTPAESAVETRYIVMPDQVNAYGTVFGGVIMSWIDMVAGMVAQRHAEGVAVTASIDRISFKAPVYVGEHVILKAAVNYVGNTSMEVGVQVTKEDPMTGEQVRATTAYLTFVGLDANKCPRVIPGLKPQTEEEKQRYEEAKLRVAARHELRAKIQEQRQS
ncbi:MAG TPA: acyl-CoA thioesterase [Bacillota bacterium]|jgi:acyl-CoA hydrolase|nr:acyl-CoA thioesterase [Bacillota bacterium]HPT68187.1 acyl-CoA thioesterase [Bacillota bacterium]